MDSRLRGSDGWGVAAKKKPPHFHARAFLISELVQSITSNETS